MSDGILLGERAVEELRRIVRDQANRIEKLERRISSVANNATDELCGATTVSLHNNTGANLPLGGVAEIEQTSDLYLAYSDLRIGRPVLDGIAPQTANLAKTMYAVAAAPIIAGEIGPAAIHGGIPALVNFTSADHRYCSPTNGETGYMTSGESGLCRVLEKPAGAGTLLCTVLMQYGPAEEETIPLYNADSSTAVAGAIARITGYNVGQSAYNIVQPSASSFSPIWVIVNDAITAGATGTGRIFKNAGMAFAYDAAEGTPAYGEMWGPKPGSWLARKRMEGLLVLKNDSDGVATGIQKWSSEVIVKLRTALDQGQSVDCQVLKWNGTKLVNSGFSLTAYDSFLNTDETIEKDTKAVVRWLYGEWLIVSAYCAPDDTEEESGDSYGGAFFTDPNVFFELNNDAFFV